MGNPSPFGFWVKGSIASLLILSALGWKTYLLDSFGSGVDLILSALGWKTCETTTEGMGQLLELQPTRVWFNVVWRKAPCNDTRGTLPHT